MRTPLTTGAFYGAPHGCSCDDDDNDGHDECERVDFAWAACDNCARPNSAGERHAVTFWYPTN